MRTVTQGHQRLCAGRRLRVQPFAPQAALQHAYLRSTSFGLSAAPTTLAGPCKLRSKRIAAAPARASRQLTVTAKAMVNVDFASPSLVLGAILIGCGVLLLQMRNLQTRVSRDADIVVAAMISIVGSTLIFQGWRLDPLLLLCQALTTSVAVWYGIETFRLRSREEELEDQGLLPPGQGNRVDGGWGPGPGTMQQQVQQQPIPPPGALPQQSGLTDWMNAFSNSGQQQPVQAQPQQQFMSGFMPQQQPLYPQQPQQPVGGYLPPAQEQQYPWGAEGQMGQYVPQQQEVLDMPSTSSPTWQYPNMPVQQGWVQPQVDPMYSQQVPYQYPASTSSQPSLPADMNGYYNGSGAAVNGTDAYGAPVDGQAAAVFGYGSGVAVSPQDMGGGVNGGGFVPVSTPGGGFDVAVTAPQVQQVQQVQQPVQATPASGGSQLSRRPVEAIDDWE